MEVEHQYRCSPCLMFGTGLMRRHHYNTPLRMNADLFAVLVQDLEVFPTATMMSVMMTFRRVQLTDDSDLRQRPVVPTEVLLTAEC